MPLARAVLVGALVTCSSSRPEARSPTNPRRRRRRPTHDDDDASDHHHDHHDHHDDHHHHAPATSSAPTSTSAPTDAPASTPTTPKPDPDAFAALANQVSQNQAMLTQLSAQVDAGDAAAGRRSATEITTTQQKLDATRADVEAAATDRARPRRVHLPARRHAEHRGRRHPARPGHQRGQEVRGVGDADRRRRRSAPSQRVSLTARRASASSSTVRVPQQQRRRTGSRTPRPALEALTAHQKKLLDEAGAIPVMGDAELTRGGDHRLVRRSQREVPPVGRDLDRRPRPDLHGGGQGRARAPGARVRAVDHRDRLVRQRARQQLRRHRRLRQLPG